MLGEAYICASAGSPLNLELAFIFSKENERHSMPTTKEKNLDPDPDMEYIYDHDTIWKRDGRFGEPADKGLILVENVKRCVDTGGYLFNIKGSSENYRCYYGWAFVENTKRNRHLLIRIKEEDELAIQHTKRIQKMQDDLDSLFNYGLKDKMTDAET
jgi:hypothetical protein